MTKLQEIRFKELEALARDRFAADLTDAELKILRDSASSGDASEAGQGVPLCPVRAEFLRWLATDPEPQPSIDFKGIRVYGARIEEKLDLEECTVSRAIHFRACEFGSEFDLRGAATQGIYLFDSTLAKGMAADLVKVDGSVLLRRIRSQSEISLTGALISGSLDCSGAQLDSDENALSADGAKIGGDLFLGVSDEPTAQRFEAKGTISLVAAEISGQLICLGAKLSAKKVALEASGLIVGDVFLRTESGPDFESFGDIRFVGANVRGDLDCSGAKFRYRSRYAFTADRATINGDVLFRDGFEADGKISLWGAQIGSYLDFCLARVCEVQCSNMNLAGDLRWIGLKLPFDGSLDLSGARLRNLRDDRRSWPKEGNAVFDGLVYDEVTLQDELSADELKKHLEGGPEISEKPLVAKERIDWLMRQAKGRVLEAQPWMFLAKHLEAKGDRKGAKHVVYAFRCLQHKESRFFLRCLKRMFAWLEENPIRILLSIAITLLLGTSIFIWAGDNGAMTESVRFQPNSIYSFEDQPRISIQKYAYPARPGEQNKPVSPLYPKFQPFVYTLENSVPLVKFGMDEKWIPNASTEFCIPWFPSIGWLYFISTYGILNFVRWTLIVWGWVQATILVAAISDRFKK